MTGGGKAIGFHSTLDSRGELWDWWRQEMGGGISYASDYFSEVTMDLDPEIVTNPALKAAWDASGLGEEIHIPETEVWVFSANPRGKEGVTMLLTVDQANTTIPDHPYCWLKKVGGGEFIYSALGHSVTDFSTGWVKSATWAWMQYLTGDFDAVGVAGNRHSPFAQIEIEKNRIRIKDGGRHSVRVFDLQARLRGNWSGSGEMAYPLPGLQSGIYYLEVKSEHQGYTGPFTIR